ncbi:transposase [Macrococcus capreoli]|uniref:transposase n=1 Tax=Macrococcus capreoli TaxID=2982690 RepID=UPI002A31B6AC|nr:transposase [Macrococcus sp. TMW 2.2395]
MVTRHIWQEYLDVVDNLSFIDTIKSIYKLRSQTIERRFADTKEQHGLKWTKHKGIQKVAMETTLIFACINLKKLANYLQDSLDILLIFLEFHYISKKKDKLIFEL